MLQTGTLNRTYRTWIVNHDGKTETVLILASSAKQAREIAYARFTAAEWNFSHSLKWIR